MKPIYFKNGGEFRRWLEINASTAAEIEIGFFNKSSGKPSITYAEAVDEALCFGWIDGLVRNVDEQRHTRRFTPRRAVSTWSLVNLKHFERLKESGRVQPAGIEAHARRRAERTGIYSFEKRPTKFPDAMEKEFRSNAGAWAHWCAQPAGYQRQLMWWVISAKRPETQMRRLHKLITLSASGQRRP